MLDDIASIVTLGALALYFYCDYKRVKLGGGTLFDYAKGILIFIVILTILSLIR